MNTNQILYGACISLTGLLAGLFYGYQCSIVNSFTKLADKEYILAFQSIIKGIGNPVFFLSFMGSILMLVITSFVYYKAGISYLLPYLIISAIVYAVGVFGITMAVNEPLNQALSKFNVVTANHAQIQEMRLQFEATWNKWHMVRTLASIVSFVVLIFPLLKKI